MTPDGRSLDDLPLAAYSTGMEPDPRLDAPEPGPADHAADADPAPDSADSPAAVQATAPPPDGAGAAPDTRAGAAGPADAQAALRERLRDPRVLLGGVIALGLVLLVASLLTGGGGALGPAAGATPSPAPSVNPTPVPGEVAMTLEGAVTATLQLTGSGGAPPVGDPFSATWTDSAGTSLTLQGRVDRGTRTTGEDLGVTVVVLIEGAPVTFASSGGECTVGMATQPNHLTGSFSCHDLQSADGKLSIDASGTYRT